MSKQKILIAIGGNSLIKDDLHLTVEDQYSAICETTEQIAQIVKADNQVVITHGNGPQVGFILRRSEIASEVAQMHSVPLESCDADTQGAIGYQIQQALDNEFRSEEMDNRAVTIITQIEVDENDPAFSNPSKPIGSFYNYQEYQSLTKEHKDWIMVEDAGRGYRRVVPSPVPKKIIEIDAIQSLYDQGFTIIAAGGGGIPVVMRENRLFGIEAVVDKDKTSALLAAELSVDTLIISTGVSNVSLNFNTDQQRDLGNVSLDEIKTYLAQGHFKPGSMKPKIEAAIQFLSKGGKEVIITDPKNLADAVFKGSGTHIRT